MKNLIIPIFAGACIGLIQISIALALDNLFRFTATGALDSNVFGVMQWFFTAMLLTALLTCLVMGSFIAGLYERIERLEYARKN